MQNMSCLILTSALFAWISTISANAETFSVAGYAFNSPSGWKASPPSSSMRKAQFAAPGKSGQAAEVVFFYFGTGGAGGVKANIDRWMGQFKNAENKKVEGKTVGGTKLTYARATGTFMSGRPFGPKTPKEGYALLGAIIEGKQGAIFVKMTGPEAAVKANSDKMRAMVESALR
ncbi:MAG: hypothetical protein CMJ38_00030 [Phycisphaerae bacterium]|nr:hypothetical protein [Phycisphaerae bacterium]